MTMLRAPPQLPTGTQDLICSKPSIWIWRNDSRTTQADARQQGYTLPDSLSTFSPRVSRVEVSYLCTRKGVRLCVRSSRQLVGDNLVTVWVLAQGRDPAAVRGRQKASETVHPLACRAIYSSLMTPSPLPNAA